MRPPRPHDPGALTALTLTALALCAPAVADAAAQEPVMFRGDPGRSGVYGGAGPAAGAVVRWRVDAGATVRSSPAVTETAVYVGTSAGALLALSRDDGAERWRYDAGSPLPSSPAVAAGLVVIAARDGAVHAVAAGTGSLRWSTPPTPELPLPWGREGWDYWVSSPVIAGDAVLVGTPDGRLLALELASGTPRWEHELGARTRSSPAVGDGAVYIGDDAGIVHAVALDDGRELWVHRTEGAGLSSAEFGWDRVSLQASPAVVDGTVYIGSRDGGVYALDAATGRRLWYADHGAPWVVASAAVRGDRVWVGSSDGEFVAALDAETGAEQWRTELGARVFASPALATGGGDGTLYVADHGGAVRALDPGTGEERWRVVLGPHVMVQGSPVPAGPELFLGADDGGVYALGPSPAPPRLAVFWDSTLADRAFRARNGRLLRDYLSDHGYRVLDATGLRGWLEARLRDAAPGVVVFAIDHVPAADPEGGGAPLLRRYLDAGGKVVWTGFPPLALVRDSTGRPTGIDHGRTAAALGVNTGGTAQGQYGALPTEEGKRWGLRGTHLSELAVEPGPGVRVLATDELGRAAVAVREYGGRRGTGLVLLWGVGADWDRLAEIRAVAEHGVLRATGSP